MTHPKIRHSTVPRGYLLLVGDGGGGGGVRHFSVYETFSSIPSGTLFGAKSVYSWVAGEKL